MLLKLPSNDTFYPKYLGIQFYETKCIFFKLKYSTIFLSVQLPRREVHEELTFSLEDKVNFFLQNLSSENVQAIKNSIL